MKTVVITFLVTCGIFIFFVPAIVDFFLKSLSFQQLKTLYDSYSCGKQRLRSRLFKS